MFKYTLDNKRYHTLNYFFKTKFNQKVVKVALNGHFSCPNFQNGNGCIYCRHGSGNNLENLSLKEQFNIIKKDLDKKWPNAKYIAYLQANTNTYAPLPILKQKYEEALNIPGVIGLDIATRPDCLSPEILDYLSELNKKTFLIVEIGLQSKHEKTLAFINRGHTLKDFEEAIYNLKKRHIFVVVHIINGLPYETEEMMLQTAKYLNTLPINGLKIHMLYIEKDTPLANYYQKKPFKLLTKEEYVDIVTKQLRLLRSDIVLMRLTGDPNKEELIAPFWLVKKVSVLNDIDKLMQKKDIYQGDLVS